MGTDCMILGAWAEPPPNSTTILDVGTGTGALALMMAQKTQQHHSLIHAIDIDHDSYLQASENFQQSPWAQRLLAAHSSFQNWVRSCSTKYDMIISNPPYFLRSNKPEASARAAARHAGALLWLEVKNPATPCWHGAESQSLLSTTQVLTVQGVAVSLRSMQLNASTELPPQ